MKKLPIGIQTFSKIRQGNYCYVDKTDLIAQLADQGEFYFLSRPRRFGKSLLIDTIAEAFQGNKELFKGLYLENHWDWQKKHPVIKIDFAQGVLKTDRQLDNTITSILNNTAEFYNISVQKQDLHLMFSDIIIQLHKKTGQRVAVLIDEYDKPILDNITNPETAQQMRDGLRNFYSVLKAQGAHLCFVMLTGVSKFSKVSLFSELNNLEDITLDPRFGTLCGYTQTELETIFQEYLNNIDLAQVKKWYNGYSFLSEPVYNPFDVLLYLRNKHFKPYWFETGTPAFLVDLLIHKMVPLNSLEDMRISYRMLNSFDVDYVEPQPLLFQTGYLTIKEEKTYPGGTYYILGFPNHEVRYAFNDALLVKLCRTGVTQDEKKLELIEALDNNHFDQLKQIIHSFFSSIPHDWYRKNDISNYEGYYCSVVYCYFTAAGLEVHPEVSTNHGQIDMTVIYKRKIYIIEFKVNELTNPDNALAQIKEKKYHGKYADRETYLIGIEFSKKDRNITRFEWEKVKSP